MICDVCGANIATVHVEKMVDNQKTAHNLCASCAAGFDMQLDFNAIFKSFLGAALSGGVKTDEIRLRCKSCGLEFSRFQKLGRFGCADCYKYFEPQTFSVLKNIHGADKHTGKLPRKLEAGIKYTRTIEQLKCDLQNAVKTENYEEAARLRDIMRGMSREGSVANDQMV